MDASRKENGRSDHQTGVNTIDSRLDNESDDEDGPIPERTSASSSYNEQYRKNDDDEDLETSESEHEAKQFWKRLKQQAKPTTILLLKQMLQSKFRNR